MALSCSVNRHTQYMRNITTASTASSYPAVTTTAPSLRRPGLSNLKFTSKVNRRTAVLYTQEDSYGYATVNEIIEDVLPELQQLDVPRELLKKHLQSQSRQGKSAKALKTANTAVKLVIKFKVLHKATGAATAQQRDEVHQQLLANPALLSETATKIKITAKRLTSDLYWNHDYSHELAKQVVAKQLCVLYDTPRLVAEEIEAWTEALQMDRQGFVDQVWGRRVTPLIPARCARKAVGGPLSKQFQELQALLQLSNEEALKLVLQQPSLLHESVEQLQGRAAALQALAKCL